jgi:DNA helicase-2/ATP-dependent DNA helicase PcrA
MIESLNPQQKQAVLHGEGPMIVVAGAGSGKTRVITSRIVHLVEERQVSPERILAITFTNKAAGEMVERVRRMLGHSGAAPWISTFHSFCLRLLRRHIGELGFPADFVIYDAQDQLALLKKCMKTAKINAEAFAPKTLLNHISGFKNDFLLPEQVDPDQFAYGNQMKAAQVYPVYQEELKNNRALDFDDLLLWTVRLFKESGPVLAHYSDRFQYILVDEFQDTNETQYHLVRQLSGTHRNVCAVGDDDQSIYRWRGANLENILHFERDFPGATLIKLEENYRSTKNILTAAGRVVAENQNRNPKTLWTKNEEGDPVVYLRAEDETDEAETVADRIQKLNLEESISFSDMAVLYRTNAQSRILEEALRKRSIPHQVFGGQKFYARKEVKDVLSYLRVILNPEDSVSLKRIINVPPRGIGKNSLDKIEAHAAAENLSLIEALRQARGIVSTAPAGKIAAFVALIDELGEACQGTPEPEFLRGVLERTGYGAMLEKDDTKEGRARMENLRELFSAVELFMEREGGSLQEFLDSTALVADVDQLDDKRGVLPIMTLHTCKGLEFQVVFIIGMEDGLLPHSSSMSDNAEYEEERRLCYVGFTRARKKLFLSNARRRRIYGSTFNYPPSSFLLAIPEDTLVRENSGQMSRASAWSAAPARTLDASRYASSSPGFASAPPAGGSASAERGEYPVGTKVLHPKFGAGVVINREGKDQAMKVEVFFKQPHGKKKLAVHLAKLIPL